MSNIKDRLEQKFIQYCEHKQKELYAYPCFCNSKHGLALITTRQQNEVITDELIFGYGHVCLVCKQPQETGSIALRYNKETNNIDIIQLTFNNKKVINDE